MRRTLLLVSILLAACGGPTPAPDAGRDAAIVDAAIVDAAFVDAAIVDAAFVDAAFADAGPDAAGLDAALESDAGEDGGGFDPLLAIGGTCGVLDTELTDAMAHWIQGTSTFPEGFTRAEDATRLSTGAQTILAEGTAGGSSGYSEALAFEVLHRCEGASLVATETMIRYSTTMPTAITDILVEIDGVRIGVSVTRAVTVTAACTRADTYSEATATELLTRKLQGIAESSAMVAPEHAWQKQILFVYADTETHASVMMTAWAALDASLRADTILYVHVSENMDAFIYFEDRCG